MKAVFPHHVLCRYHHAGFLWGEHLHLNVFCDGEHSRFSFIQLHPLCCNLYPLEFCSLSLILLRWYCQDNLLLHFLRFREPPSNTCSPYFFLISGCMSLSTVSILNTTFPFFCFLIMCTHYLKLSSITVDSSDWLRFVQARLWLAVRPCLTLSLGEMFNTNQLLVQRSL